MKKKIIPVIVVFFLIMIIAGVGLASRYIPTKERMNLTEYYGQAAEGEAILILGTEKMEERALISNGNAYLSLSIVNAYLNERYYWDADNQQILYATPSVLEYYPGSAEGGNDVWIKDGVVYLNINFIKKYTDIDAYVYENPSRVIIQYDFTDLNTVTVQKKGYIRYQGGTKSPVLTGIAQGATLLLLEEMETWACVATFDGYIGYIEREKISVPSVISLERSFQKEEYSYISMDEKVNLVWHQVMSTDANAYLADDTAEMTGVNVISPTWFSVTDNAGTISCIATHDYVSHAHSMGLQVWGLIDNFNENISTTEVLSHTASRQNIVQQLISYALEYSLDGINVDFENFTEDAAIHFLQFLRELSIETHKNGLILSVDLPVPEVYTSYYNREEQGEVVDYIIIMGYDEHYVGSLEPGSVASLPWVEKGVQDTLKEVPAERVINAIPFYARLWRLEGEYPYSEAIGMDLSKQVLDENNADIYWNTDVSQYIGSYEKEGYSYQIWVEETKSIAEKVKLVPKYNLAGVAAWKLGFENSQVWQVITDNLYSAAE